ncbi:MAG: nitronate monooxygenase [Acidobacteriales bacterium]|nr:nitronate monooxygenase [Terriglobales bacterium]
MQKDNALNRRVFLELGAATTASVALGQLNLDHSTIAAEPLATRPVFRTALCDLLGIEYPIIQAGMSGVATPELVAAVSGAGGLGILSGTLLPIDELRNRIRQVRNLTDKPFGVNLVLHTHLRTPADVSLIPENTVRAAQEALNRFRDKLGLKKTLERPARIPDLLDAAFEVIIEERVPVFSIGLGNPAPEMVAHCHQHGIKVIAMVTTVDDARQVAASGVDALVAQGSEAGGHRSTWVKRESKEAANIGTLALVPQIVDAVKVPVIAAGGITDGRGLLSAIALGASGVMIGTRFIATRESGAPEFYKRALLERSSDTTTVTDVFTGMYARVLRSTFTQEYAASGAPVLPPFFQFLAGMDINNAAIAQKNGEYFPMYAGQGVGSFHDTPGAAEIVQTLVREGQEVIKGLSQRIRAT